MKLLLKNWLFLNKKSLITYKKQKALLCFLLSCYGTFLSQTVTNVVPNWSFESHTTCPTYTNSFPLNNWFSPTGTTTDLYDSCSTQMNVPWSQGSFYSPIYSMSGHGYIGMHQYNTGNREYAQTQLTTTLSSNGCYYAEFYTRIMGISPQAINNMGLNFSVSSYTSYASGPAVVVPTHITLYGNPIIKDSLNWIKVNGIYNSIGGESFVALGNFNDNSNTDTLFWHPTSPFGTSSYYFVDAVSVFSINPTGNLPWSYRDTTVTLGDSVYIGNNMGGNFNPAWYTYSGSLITHNAGIYVKPTVTTQYIVQYTVCGVQRKDTVKVSVSVGINDISFYKDNLKIYPQPAQDILNIQFNLKTEQGLYHYSIYNNLGQLLKEEELEFKNKTAIINTADLSNGVYSIRLKNNKGFSISNRFIVSK